MYSVVNKAKKEALNKEILDHYGHTCSICGFNRHCVVEAKKGKPPRQRYIRSPYKLENRNYGFYQKLKKEGFPTDYASYCPGCLADKSIEEEE